MLEAGFHPVPKGHLTTVVTYLDMTEQPAARPVPTPENVTLTRQDRIAAETYRTLFRAIGEDYLWFSRLHLSDEELADIFQHPEYALYTLQRDGRDLALLELDFRKEQECTLAFFGLHADLIGTGAGRFLMNKAIELAWDKPIKRFRLHTCTLDSPQALPFYIRSGFTPYKQEVEIAPDPRITGKLSPDAAPQIPKLS